jgi:hypothetical protein
MTFVRTIWRMAAVTAGMIVSFNVAAQTSGEHSRPVETNTRFSVSSVPPISQPHARQASARDSNQIVVDIRVVGQRRGPDRALKTKLRASSNASVLI